MITIISPTVICPYFNTQYQAFYDTTSGLVTVQRKDRDALPWANVGSFAPGITPIGLFISETTQAVLQIYYMDDLTTYPPKLSKDRGETWT